jgi:hypothetical protein
MMLMRVAAQIRTTPDLNGQLLPIPFMEESHEVLSIADFWLECLFHLANALRSSESEHDKRLADPLLKTCEALYSIEGDQTLVQCSGLLSMLASVQERWPGYLAIIAALRQELGETVNASQKQMEVAQDVRKIIAGLREKQQEVPGTSKADRILNSLLKQQIRQHPITLTLCRRLT